MAGAPLGNQNAAKAKQWSAAIERAIERLGDSSINPDHPHERSPRVKGLDLLADEFVAKVRDGGIPGFSEMGDRLEGKPKQVITGDPDSPLAIELIERSIVDPKA